MSEPTGKGLEIVIVDQMQMAGGASSMPMVMILMDGKPMGLFAKVSIEFDGQGLPVVHMVRNMYDSSGKRMIYTMEYLEWDAWTTKQALKELSNEKQG